ncbi:MAG: phosphatase PAP2 family protein [Ferruginibacter sp.]
MKGRIKLLAIVLIFPFISYAQVPAQADTLIKKLDSLQQKDSGNPDKPNNINPKAYTENTNLTPSTYFILLGSNIKQQFTTPFHTSKRGWVRFAEFAVFTTALSFADKPVNRFAINITTDHKTIINTSSFITKVGGLYEAYTLAALGTYSFIFKDQKLKTTTLLATQAYVTAGLSETVLKFLTGRQRPNYYDAVTKTNNPTFHGPFSKTLRDVNGAKLNGSFPSGHAAVAFAAATVFAQEYRDRPWVPVVSYSAATLIALSRLTENKHWITDVFVGSALGYLTGRQITNNYHRYARIKNGEKQKQHPVALTVQYFEGRLLPGLIYHL